MAGFFTTFFLGLGLGLAFLAFVTDTLFVGFLVVEAFFFVTGFLVAVVLGLVVELRELVVLAVGYEIKEETLIFRCATRWDIRLGKTYEAPDSIAGRANWTCENAKRALRSPNMVENVARPYQCSTR